MFKPIDIIYKPTKRIEIEPLCYFSDDISKAYLCLHSKGMSRAHKCYQCYYCNEFFILETRRKDIWKIVQEGQELSIILITKT